MNNFPKKRTNPFEKPITAAKEEKIEPRWGYYEFIHWLGGRKPCARKESLPCGTVLWAYFSICGIGDQCNCYGGRERAGADDPAFRGCGQSE